MAKTDEQELDPHTDYPLGTHRSDLVRTPTGKRLEDLTIEAVVSGELAAEDLRIAPDTLLMQAQIAEGVGRRQLAENFRRAAEMAPMPDERVLAVYNALRPSASTKQQLLDLADELENEFAAERNAALIREAAEVYERRDLLLAEN
jgi:propanediol dehydratase small subunit